MKPIHERVRAKLERDAKQAQAKLDRSVKARIARAEARDIKREARIEALFNGTVMPETRAEMDMVNRYEFEMM